MTSTLTSPPAAGRGGPESPPPPSARSRRRRTGTALEGWGFVAPALVIVLGLRRGLADVVHDWVRDRRARRAAAAEPAPEEAAPAAIPDGALKGRIV